MKRIYLYLFIFSLIINIFLIVNDGRILKAKDQHIESLEKRLKRSQDSLKALEIKNSNQSILKI